MMGMEKPFPFPLCPKKREYTDRRTLTGVSFPWGNYTLSQDLWQASKRDSSRPLTLRVGVRTDGWGERISFRVVEKQRETQVFIVKKKRRG